MRDASFLCQNRLPEECLQLMEFVEFGIFKEFVRKHSGGNIYMRVEKVNMRKETLLKVLKSKIIKIMANCTNKQAQSYDKCLKCVFVLT